MAYRKGLYLPLVAVAAMTVSGCGSSNRETSVQAGSSLNASAGCIACHSGKINEYVYSGYSEEEARRIPEEWILSAHNEENGASCATCHQPPEGHPLVPGEPITDLATIDGVDPICMDCHGPGADYTPDYHFADSGTTAQYATTPYPQFFSERDAAKNCTRCHNPHLLHGEQVGEFYEQYAASGHGNVTAPAFTEQDFKLNDSSGGCVRCHTTTGFVRYVESGYTAMSAWGDPSDPAKETVQCFACHNEYPGELRTEQPVVAMRALTGDIPARYVDMSGSDVTFPNDSESNRCFVCHAGRNSGGNIASAGISDWNGVSFAPYAPHYLPAAGTLFAKIGYEFPSQSYAGPWVPHASAGVGGVGPCATCHMNNDNHTFVAVQEACAQCHGSENPLTVQPEFQAALEVLKQQLAVAGFAPLDSYPYFDTTAWGTGTTGRNNIGAAFNYWYLNGDPGAFAHAPAYVQQILYDSIDWLDNQAFDQSVQAGVIPALVNEGTLTQAQADLALAYFADGRPAEPPALAKAAAKVKAFLNKLLH